MIDHIWVVKQTQPESLGVGSPSLLNKTWVEELELELGDSRSSMTLKAHTTQDITFVHLGIWEEIAAQMEVMQQQLHTSQEQLEILQAISSSGLFGWHTLQFGQGKVVMKVWEVWLKSTRAQELEY